MSKFAKGDNIGRWRKKDWSQWDHASRVIEYCGEKIIYPTLADAERMRVQQEEKWSMELRTYLCEHGHWHLTSRVY